MKLTIGKVAKLSGVGVETVRYYEREGILQQPKRHLGSVREYPEETVHRLHFIKRAQELGFSLQEILELLSLRSKPSGSCAKVVEKAEVKLQQIEKKIADLRKIHSALSKLKDRCGQQAPSDRCLVLDSFHA